MLQPESDAVALKLPPAEKSADDQKSSIHCSELIMPEKSSLYWGRQQQGRKFSSLAPAETFILKIIWVKRQRFGNWKGLTFVSVKHGQGNPI